MRLILSILLTANTSLALTQDDLVEIINLRCDFTNNKILFDIREKCMLDYVNCSIKLGGEIDIKDLDKCIAKKREVYK